MASKTSKTRDGFSKNFKYEKHKLLFTYFELLQVRWSLLFLFISKWYSNSYFLICFSINFSETKTKVLCHLQLLHNLSPEITFIRNYKNYWYIVVTNSFTWFYCEKYFHIVLFHSSLHLQIKLIITFHNNIPMHNRSYWSG